MNDFPRYKISITPEMDWSAERLQFTTKTEFWANKVIRESICFKDKVIRQTLITLGWTPPPDPPAFPGYLGIVTTVAPSAPAETPAPV